MEAMRCNPSLHHIRLTFWFLLQRKNLYQLTMILDWYFLTTLIINPSRMARRETPHNGINPPQMRVRDPFRNNNDVDLILTELVAPHHK